MTKKPPLPPATTSRESTRAEAAKDPGLARLFARAYMAALAAQEMAATKKRDAA